MVYLEFRTTVDWSLGKRLEVSQVPDIGELVKFQAVVYHVVARAWLYDDDGVNFCVVTLIAADADERLEKARKLSALIEAEFESDTLTVERLTELHSLLNGGNLDDAPSPSAP